MYVAVRQRGGFAGLDRKVEIREGRVRVTEKGETREGPSLDEPEQSQLKEIVGKVLKSKEGIVPLKGSSASDSMDTHIEVGEGDERRTLKLRSGDDAPTEIWELLGAVGRVASSASPASNTTGVESASPSSS
jgi:ribosome-associated protein YbcJ (S4-like RNA binding protein)